MFKYSITPMDDSINSNISSQSSKNGTYPFSHMPSYKVTSEIYSEFDYKTKKPPSIEGNVVSEFPFRYPSNDTPARDEDGDLVIENRKNGLIQIEHCVSTALPLVGLQVWRGALLLGDLALHWGSAGRLKGAHVLELGAGTGITSFVTSMYADKVVCTDINVGGILDLIKQNMHRNENIIKSKFAVKEIDFTKELAADVLEELASINLIFAADTIYDDDLTESFLKLLQKLLNMPPKKSIIIALEKRYVFTVTDFDSVAPCYETFLTLVKKYLKPQWTMEQIPIDIPQYFKYERVKELVLWKISS